MGCTDASDLRAYFSGSCTFLVILRRPREGAGGTTGFHNPEDEDEDEEGGREKAERREEDKRNGR